jgi:UTP--glucose-1-phosphate uridylyltransferase
VVSQDRSFALIAEKMRLEGISEIAIRNFGYYYDRLQSGQNDLIAEARIRPVDSLPDADSFEADPALVAAGEAALSRTVMLKLNGGLGTSMGLNQTKSLLVVKNGQTMLDMMAQQAIKHEIPLIFMNSFSTQEDTLAALARYPELQYDDIPQDFLQNKVPKITCTDLTPVQWPDNPALEWCPPGHGDIYVALITSGIADKLTAAGYRYIFMSNSDNLGAVVDVSILGYFVTNQLPLMMEVADRSRADRKGGHLAYLLNDQLILRESSQCPPEDMQHFEDISRHRFFNTNNLWLDLAALKQVMEDNNYMTRLPMITNKKTVDPRDDNSTPVYQLETAMGSGLGMFKNSGAVRVSRKRFSPIKTTEDLLSVRSDAYIVTEDHRIILDPCRTVPPFVQLDATYYRLIDDLEVRFPHGAPSLRKCRSLTINGDVSFGRQVVLEGDVWFDNPSDDPMQIGDHTHIVGD